MQGLLTKFMIEKVNAYREPTRQGTAKGDPIGLSTPKFRAALWCITSESLKNIAVAVGTSYGMLRVWRTEAEFLKTIDELADEFAHLFWKEFSLFTDITFQAILDGKMEAYENFTDIAFYGNPVLKAIFNKMPDSANLYQIASVIQLLDNPKDTSRLAEDRRSFSKKIRRYVTQDLYEKALKNIQKPEMTKEDIQEVLVYLLVNPPK